MLLQGLGRIVQLDATLKAVCPGKQVAVSVILTENTLDPAFSAYRDDAGSPVPNCV